ncbi:competence protein CoiA [Rhizobium sullae]|uniref:Competence protein CoiA n=1 Tax=Rhizobium sullae TaxID=50338 RepID=A0A4R3Q3W0_RHISU|nr:competence protein CoiA family protein [Rhizobium sullae]TCU15104.1 competence protein CoiA [Rhizobium sullae]
MPLRCLDENDVSLHAFDLSADAWRELSERNRKKRSLRMPCCSAAATMRRSRRGTQFFAHKAAGDCSTAPEKEAHLRLKQIAVEAARKYGWDARTEVIGQTPSGDPWTADVLARKNSAVVAIEIQWSAQTPEETLRRHERYKQSGIRCLWLLRKTMVATSHALPAARISEQDDGVYLAHLSGPQHMPVDVFLDAAFGSRLRFGVPLGVSATAAIRVGTTQCWNSSCRQETRIVTGIDIQFGPHVSTFSVSELGKYPDLFEMVVSRLPADPAIGRLKMRFSKTQERSYTSNGCFRCDSLIGEHFEIHARYSEDVMSLFPIHIDASWKLAIENLRHHEDGWSVYPSAITS